MSVQIRLGRTDSVYSVNRENSLDVELKNTSKPIHHNDIKRTIDIYEQYKKERAESTRYRLILTLHPYCTNILFNPLTEIMKNEGSPVSEEERPDSVEVITDKSSEPSRVDMIRNTEYSNNEDGHGYEYHPGYDMFDNHILKNTGFKVVNPISEKTAGDTRGKYNTESDFARDSDGATQAEWIRTSINNVVHAYKHLYNGDELLSFEDSISANLSEENGWWGFANASNIETRYLDKDGKPKSLGIEKVLNNRKSCEFIDMYPDRTLYSFAPKWNKFRRRLEYNWDVVLTYPHSMVEGIEKGPSFKCGNYNGLPLVDITPITNNSGGTSYVFRSVLKHGLRSGDYIRLYYKDSDGWKSYYEVNSKDFRVASLGNFSDGDEEYYFTVYDDDLVGVLSIEGAEFSFARVAGDIPSKYYFRKFKKLPNFKWKKKNYDGTKTFDDYVDDESNGIKGVTFDNEWYKLAFANTIYGDEIAQITFTDTIDIQDMTDADGRPICEIYATILKTNRGHDKWYKEQSYTDESVEFSHCFGPLQAGLETTHELFDNIYESILDKRKDWSDVRLINDSDEDSKSKFDDDIDSKTDDEFYGDVVEYNATNALPRQLQMFQYRFNTMQRELAKDAYYGDIHYTDFSYDDYNAGYKETTSTQPQLNDNFSFQAKYFERTARKEGYYYNPHHLIRLRAWGSVNQSSHTDLNIKKVYLKPEKNLYLVVETLRSAKVNEGDVVLMSDNVNNKSFYFTVAYTPDRLTIYLTPTADPNKEGNGWKQLLDRLNAEYEGTFVPVDALSLVQNGKFKLLRINPSIPRYADKVSGRNTYFWRNVFNSGDTDDNGMESYDFANGAFYISEDVNLFLKRQDPHNESGLYNAENPPSDIRGVKLPESKYNYIPEEQNIC